MTFFNIESRAWSYHTMANNMEWTEQYLNKEYPDSIGLEDRLWMHKLRPELSQIASKPSILDTWSLRKKLLNSGKM
jgi:hypothetical protein